MKDSIAIADKVANEMAYEFDRLGTDPNEVSFALATLRQMLSEQEGKREIGPQFFRFVDTVVREGRAVVRSGRTLDYYRQILEVCREHLSPYQDDPEKMAYILGWAARLMRYYAVEDKLGRKAGPPKPARRRRAPRPTAEGDCRTGTVKKFEATYGFIKPDSGGEDIFVHKSQLASGLTSLSSGQRVTYEIGQSCKGPEARNVRLA